jgi:hypothetical protein
METILAAAVSVLRLYREALLPEEQRVHSVRSCVLWGRREGRRKQVKRKVSSLYRPLSIFTFLAGRRVLKQRVFKLNLNSTGKT